MKLHTKRDKTRTRYCHMKYDLTCAQKLRVACFPSMPQSNLESSVGLYRVLVARSAVIRVDRSYRLLVRCSRSAGSLMRLNRRARTGSSSRKRRRARTRREGERTRTEADVLVVKKSIVNFCVVNNYRLSSHFFTRFSTMY